MIKVDESVINLVEKIRKVIRENKMQAEFFPMDEIYNLIECTLGDSFWDCIGSQANFGFGSIPETYKECLMAAVERKDMEACERILYLFECTYQALYTALNEEEKIFREKPYRQMIIDMGNSSAQLQYRLHEQRQKALGVKRDKELAKGKGVVYTCLFGDKVLNQPREVSVHVDYLCFTDKKEKWGTKDGVWKYCAVENTDNLKEELLESKYKIMAHQLLKEYDYSIWVAPDITIVGDVMRFSQVYGNGCSFLGFSSSKDDCIYDDISVTQMATDDVNINIRKMMLRYRKEGYPEHNGLIDDRIMVRNHRDEEVCQIMETWWEETSNSYVSIGNVFNYLAWKYKFPFAVCNLFIYDNIYFKVSDIDLDTNELM